MGGALIDRRQRRWRSTQAEHGSVMGFELGRGSIASSTDGEPDVWDGDAEPLCDDGDRDDDSAPELHGLELAGADELVGGGAADAEEIPGLGHGQGEGSIGSHDLLGLLRGQDLTRAEQISAEQIQSVESEATALGHAVRGPRRRQVPRQGNLQGCVFWRGSAGSRDRPDGMGDLRYEPCWRRGSPMRREMVSAARASVAGSVWL